MVKYLLLAVFSIPSTNVWSMDTPVMSNHSYSRLQQEDNSEDDLLYPGNSNLSPQYENMNAEELYELGVHYYLSPTKDNDLKKVRLILKKAVEKGHPHAAERLGYMWEKGDGGDINIEEAKRLYSQAGREGVESALMRLAAIYEQMNDIDLAYKVCAPLAIQGNTKAQTILGNILLKGGVGGKKVTDKDIHQAIEWYTKAADEEDAAAQTALGNIFLKGRAGGKKVIAPNLDQAIEWYTKAATQGYILAKYHLGNIYYKTGNSTDAIIKLKEVVENGEAEKELGRKRLGNAAHILAFIYNDLYDKGKYLETDKIKKLYQKAIDLGNKDAKRNLDLFNIELAKKEDFLAEMRMRFKRSSPSKLTQK